MIALSFSKCRWNTKIMLYCSEFCEITYSAYYLLEYKRHMGIGKGCV